MAARLFTTFGSYFRSLLSLPRLFSPSLPGDSSFDLFSSSFFSFFSPPSVDSLAFTSAVGGSTFLSSLTAAGLAAMAAKLFTAGGGVAFTGASSFFSSTSLLDPLFSLLGCSVFFDKFKRGRSPPPEDAEDGAPRLQAEPLLDDIGAPRPQADPLLALKRLCTKKGQNE